MKKLVVILFALALLASLSACGKRETVAPGGADPLAAMSLQEILDASLKDVPDLPEYGTMPLDAENFEFYAFVPYQEGYEGLEADAMVSIQPHSVVLVRVPEDEAEEVAGTMQKNADPRKWICVEAEKTVVDYSGGTILLVMSSGEIANQVLTNFMALYGAAPSEEELALPKTSEEELPPEVVTVDDSALGEAEIALADGPEEVKETSEAESKKEPEAEGTMAVQPVRPAAQPQPEQPEEAPEQPTHLEEVLTEPGTPAGADLSAEMAGILNGVADLPDLMEWELEPEMFDYIAFLPYQEGCRALVSEAAINALAHSVVLVELPTEADAVAAAAAMKANADPAKWICVEAESVQTTSKGRLALLVMSSQDTADAIVTNFNAQ